MSNIDDNCFVKSDFDESQENKKERFSELERKRLADSDYFSKRSADRVSGIPVGQPILVGHHSENLHRRILDKSWNDLGKSVEATKKAEHYARKANAVGTGGIASDDPKAIIKLKEKLSSLVSNQAKMKAVNAEYRKGGFDGITSLNTKSINVLKDSFDKKRTSYFKPFESYLLTNNNAKIRNTKKRIKDLERRRSEKPFEFENEYFRFFIEDGRMCIDFVNGKPNDEVLSLVKSSGFRWSRYNVRWQRKYTNNCLYASKYLIENLNNLDNCY